MNDIRRTLCLVKTDKQILLGMKKRGFGANLWNGFGGKIEKDETIQAAAKRELFEECGLTALEIEQRGLINFQFEDGLKLQVHLFDVVRFTGEPVETEEMNPKWFNFDQIPFDQMWPDDVIWMPYFLQGKKFEANFNFKDQKTITDYKLTETN